MSQYFKSVNPAYHQLWNEEFAKLCNSNWTKNPVARCILFDGPDVKTTKTIVRHKDYLSSYNVNITYFQKEERVVNCQLNSLCKLWGDKNAMNLLKEGAFEELIDVKRMRSSKLIVPPQGNLNQLFLDSWSFADKFTEILKTAIALKAFRVGDTEPVTFFCNEIGCASDRKLAMIQALSATSNSWSRLLQQQLYNRQHLSSILDSGKARVQLLAEKFGFELAPLPLFDENVYTKARMYTKGENYTGVLYQGAPGSTLMHLFAFTLVKREQVNLETVVASMPVIADSEFCNEDMLNDSEESEHIISSEDDNEMIDDSNSGSTLSRNPHSNHHYLYCNPHVVQVVYCELQGILSRHKRSIQDVFERVKGKTPLQVVDIMINVNLPSYHKHKRVKNLLIVAKERTGKSYWREIFQLVMDTTAFSLYALNTTFVEYSKYHQNEQQHTTSSSTLIRRHPTGEIGYRGSVMHTIAGPNVSIVVNDMTAKSGVFMQTSGKSKGSALHLLPGARKLDESINNDPRTPYAAGMSVSNVSKLLKAITMMKKRGVLSCVIHDEVDLLVSSLRQTGFSAAFCELLSSEDVNGHVFQTATPLGVMLPDANSRVLSGHIEVFDIQAPEDYKNGYLLVEQLKRGDKFDINENNGMHRLVQDYLNINIQDRQFFNDVDKTRVFPIMLLMPCTQVLVQNGTMGMAKNLSKANTYKHITGNPLCVCFCGSNQKFHLYDNGDEVSLEELLHAHNNANYNHNNDNDRNSEEDTTKPKTLQDYLAVLCKAYNFTRHVVVLGYGVFQRGVTSQFTARSSDGYDILGVPSHLVCVINENAGGEFKRPLSDMRQLLKRYPICTQHFNVPFFENYACRISFNPELITILNNMEQEEYKLLQLLSQTKDLDKAWELFQPEHLYRRAQTINRQKRQLDDVYREQGKLVQEVDTEKRGDTVKFPFTQTCCIQYVLAQLSNEQLMAINQYANPNGKSILPDFAKHWILAYLKQNNRIILKTKADDVVKSEVEILSEMADEFPYFGITIPRRNLHRVDDYVFLAIAQRFTTGQMPIIDNKFVTDWRKTVETNQQKRLRR
jgi:hypothetical protein